MILFYSSFCTLIADLSYLNSRPEEEYAYNMLRHRTLEPGLQVGIEKVQCMMNDQPFLVFQINHFRD